MHELPVTKSICEIVLRHAAKNNASRVLSVNLEIGALSDLQRAWVQRYFDYLSRDTVAEGANVSIDRVPATFRCDSCQQPFQVVSLLAEGVCCGRCNAGDVTMLSGRQYLVKNIEVI